MLKMSLLGRTTVNVKTTNTFFNDTLGVFPSRVLDSEGIDPNSPIGAIRMLSPKDDDTIIESSDYRGLDLIHLIIGLDLGDNFSHNDIIDIIVMLNKHHIYSIFYGKVMVMSATLFDLISLIAALPANSIFSLSFRFFLKENGYRGIVE